MRTALVVRTIASGAVFYILATACGASEQSLSARADASTSIVDAFADRLASPVPTASGQTPPSGSGSTAPTLSDEPCTDDGYGTRFAKHTYSGKAARDLYTVRAVCQEHAPQTIGGEQYASRSLLNQIYHRDGQVAVVCEQDCDSITFILP